MEQVTRRSFVGTLGSGLAALAAGGLAATAGVTTAAAQTGAQGGPARRLNILFITADDMNYNTPGVTGGLTPDITPNIDRLAREGVRFVHAHVTVAVCQPSRECLMTGRYPHRNGATGFYPVRNDVPTLQESLKSAGYLLGILGKVSHLKPDTKFPWDFRHDANELGNGRDPSLYYQFTKAFLQQSKDSGKPFFLMANSHDPHRPWAGSEQEKQRPAKKGKKAGKGKKALTSPTSPAGLTAPANAQPPDNEENLGGGKYPSPDRIYAPAEVAVPGFLPDLPDVRKETAQYYSSAHRCDQTVGEVLRALKESGLEENTLVMFLSDNGISMPFAKSNCYLTSTRTPWIVRWPGRVKPGAVDGGHFISGIDYMPTILEAAGLPLPDGMDGRSFLPLLTGGEQEGRDRVFTCYNDNSGGRHYPMRCLQTKRFGYIYNAWSDGKAAYRTEPMGGLTFAAMERAAREQKPVADRVQLLLYRVPEEFYDFESDPNALRNLIGDAKHAGQIGQMRQEIAAWMERTKDPLLEPYRAAIKSKP